MHDSGSRDQCHVTYGYIRDKASNGKVNLCGGCERKKAVMESTGHSVEVVLSDDAMEEDNRFLLTYQGMYIAILVIIVIDPL